MPPSKKNKEDLVQKAAITAKSKSISKPVSAKSKCPKVEPCNPGFFDENKTYSGKDGNTYSGKELNDAAKTIYSESSGAGQTKDVEERKKEKDAIMATLTNRRNGVERYNFNSKTGRYEKPKNFSEVTFGRNRDYNKETKEYELGGYQFDGVTSRKWENADSKSIEGNSLECSDLTDSCQSVQDFLKNGIATNKQGNPLNYDYFNSEKQAAENKIRGTTIGGTRFRKGQSWK